MDKKTEQKPNRDIQNANLKRDAGPGRPKGQRNYKSIQRDALMKIGKTRNMTLEEVEETIQEVGLLKAMKGDYNFYRDYMDREHGKVPEKNINVNVAVEPTDRIKELADKLNS